MPAPSTFHFFRLEKAVDPAAYPDRARFFEDLVKVYCTELEDLAAAGCRYVQFAGQLRQICAERPSGMRLGLHLCRGNFRGRWMAAGGYEPVAAKVFNGVPVDVFLLEYDGERAGDFAPLRLVPESKSSCSVSYPPNSSVSKKLTISCAASRRQGASCP